MYVCMCSCVHAQLPSCICGTGVHACACVSGLHVCMSTHMFTCKHVCMYACMYSHTQPSHSQMHTHARQYHICTKEAAHAHTNTCKHTCNPTWTHTKRITIRLHRTSRECQAGTGTSGCSCQSWVQGRHFLCACYSRDYRRELSVHPGTSSTGCHSRGWGRALPDPFVIHVSRADTFGTACHSRGRGWALSSPAVKCSFIQEVLPPQV